MSRLLGVLELFSPGTPSLSFVKRRFSASRHPGGLYRSGAFHELLVSPLNEGASVLSGFDWGLSLPRQTTSFSWVQCAFLSFAEEGLQLEGGTITAHCLVGFVVDARELTGRDFDGRSRSDLLSSLGCVQLLLFPPRIFALPSPRESQAWEQLER